VCTASRVTKSARPLSPRFSSSSACNPRPTNPPAHQQPGHQRRQFNQDVSVPCYSRVTALDECLVFDDGFCLDARICVETNGRLFGETRKHQQSGWTSRSSRIIINCHPQTQSVIMAMIAGYGQVITESVALLRNRETKVDIVTICRVQHGSTRWIHQSHIAQVISVIANNVG